jgi:hypothetical protein
MVTVMHSARRCRPRALVWSAAVLGLALASLPAWGQAPATLAEQVRLILLTTVNVGDPPKATQLTDLAARLNVPVEQIHEVLIALAGQPLASRDPADEGAVLARRAIENLGFLRVAAAAPLLERIAAQDEVLRGPAIRARARVGGEGLLDFARNVVEHQELYPALDRYALYEELSPYVGVDAVQPVLLENQGGRGGARDSAVTSLLVRAAATDPDAGNFVRLDQILCLADAVYRCSDVRETRLQEVARSRAAVHQTYAAGQLTVLRALPAAQRTHLEVEPPPQAPRP